MAERNKVHSTAYQYQGFPPRTQTLVVAKDVGEALKMFSGVSLDATLGLVVGMSYVLIGRELTSEKDMLKLTIAKGGADLFLNTALTSAPAVGTYLTFNGSGEVAEAVVGDNIIGRVNGGLLKFKDSFIKGDESQEEFNGLAVDFWGYNPTLKTS